MLIKYSGNIRLQTKSLDIQITTSKSKRKLTQRERCSFDRAENWNEDFVV